MNSGASVHGVDLIGLYQFGCVRFTNFTQFVGDFYPTVFMAWMNCTTGQFLLAEDMPVKFKPGFFQQGPKDKFGDSAVFHGKIIGGIFPPVVETTIGASMPYLANTRMTGWRTYNTGNSAKQKTYIPFSTSFTEYNFKRYHHDVNIVYDDTSSSVITFSSNRKAHVSEFRWRASNTTYKYDITVKVTGNLMHHKTSVSDKSAHFNQGSWSQVLTDKWGYTYKTSGTNSGLVFDPLTPPINMTNLSSAIVLSPDCDVGSGRVQRDLLDLANLPEHNAPWLSCYNAVESMKYVNFQWASFGRDAHKFSELITPLKNLVHLWKPKAWGELFLWWSYGVAPTMSDVKEITHSMGKLKGNTVDSLASKYSQRITRYGTSYDTTEYFRGSKTTLKCNTRVKLATAIQPKDWFGILIQFLTSLDIGLDTTNIWELIPYSFVVDWFVNTSDLAKWIDSLIYPNQYDLEQRVSSSKRSVVLEPSLYYPGFKGYFELAVYNRLTSKDFPSQPFELRFSADFPHHWMEAAALLITRR